jgi:enoyl-CoA hydratase
MTGHVELSISDGVGHILIARPEKHNAITRDMASQLRDICREIDDNDQIKAATITGAGERAFSAGSDLNALADISQIWNFRNRVEYAAVVRDIRKPVIAGLKGWVLGGGMEIALAADIRIAGRSARIGGPEVTRGWVGGGGAAGGGRGGQERGAHLAGAWRRAGSYPAGRVPALRPPGRSEDGETHE